MPFTRRPHHQLVHRSTFPNCTPATATALWASLTTYERCFVPVLLFRLSEIRKGDSARLDRLENNTLFRIATAGAFRERCALWEELGLSYDVEPSRVLGDPQYVLPSPKLPRPVRRVMPPLGNWED